MANVNQIIKHMKRYGTLYTLKLMLIKKGIIKSQGYKDKLPIMKYCQKLDKSKYPEVLMKRY